jgi:hypothetical protein
MVWRPVECYRDGILEGIASSCCQEEVVLTKQGDTYTAVELRTGVLAGAETPVLNQSEV